jgi:predicted Ser/Thr protein kinase
MERRFLVEAKAFRLSAKEGPSDFRLEERRKGFVGVIFAGYEGSAWLVDRVDEVIKSPMKEDFVKSYRKEAKVLMIRRGANKAGRFLEVAI